MTSYNGRTIKVLSIDGERHLVLAYGITYVKELSVSKLIDVATLTSAVEAALGSVTTGCDKP